LVNSENKSMQRHIGFALLLVASVARGQAQPSAPAYRSRVLGVFDVRTGEPIEGVEITDLASGTWALTTKTGTVSLVFLPEGESSVRARKLGYAPITKSVRISPADTTPITLIMTPVVNVLPDVIVKDSAPHYISPGLRDFEARRKTHLGQYITEAELRKADARELPDVLRRLSGTMVSCTTRTPRQCALLSSRLVGGCPYVIYLDGIRMSDPNLLLYSVMELGAVEAYSATTAPAQYSAADGRRQSCGVLLLWSRER
jgi:hypothetical protein